MGWPGLTGPPGTQKGPRARAWARGQARRPVRHGPQSTTGPLGPLSNVPGVVPGRAGPARCPGIPIIEQLLFLYIYLIFYVCAAIFDVMKNLVKF